MIKPIRPEECKKLIVIPDFVIEIFNTMIVEEYDGKSSIVKQPEVIKRIEEYLKVNGGGPFNIKWLNVEELYRANGWRVVYDRPAYCETYAAYFTFTKRKVNN